MDVKKVQGALVLREGEQHCADTETAFYARCSYCWPEFHDAGCMIYNTIHECGYAKKLDVSTKEEAEALVKQMNEETKCPKCHQKIKWRAMTEIEILEQERVVENVMNRDISNTR